ncbi:MAG: bifunctional response regulator/alkaline phosphatase family protein [Bacteroidales bacterium]|nr:bifunctional response regulator/alkaline phosphatase family protein [Bacteroidales bacterium]
MLMKQIRILWTDDEIDLLKPHIIFLKQKSYHIDTATNGSDAIELVKDNDYDIIFLDENMPGLSGLETLSKIKTIKPLIPVVMITKSEEENIMDEAIGSKINDYLIKPVNPNQILLAIKKNIDKDRLVTAKTTSAYQSEFSRLGMEINDSLSYEDWIEVYKKLTYWELELSNSQDSTMDEILKMQLKEANISFAKFIKKNYTGWFDSKNEDKPLLSPNLLKNTVFPLLKDGQKVVFLLMDNLRFDQWKSIEPLLSQAYKLEKEDLYYSILPTATQYSRNSLFSGLMPSEINKLYPELWKNDDEEGGKNLYEKEMLKAYLQRYSINSSFYYEKVTDIKYCKRIADNANSILNNQFVTIVVNFIDALSHARTDQKMIRELANTTNAYRAITRSWFEFSPLFEMLKVFAEHDVHLIISTDHGSIQVGDPVKIIGDKATTTNLRYKQGRSLNYNKKDVFEILNPDEAYLPKTNISSTYVFAQGTDFFAYPNNYNYYVKYYKDTFQHGGVSLQEMIIPLIHMKSK